MIDEMMNRTRRGDEPTAALKSHDPMRMGLSLSSTISSWLPNWLRLSEIHREMESSRLHRLPDRVSLPTMSLRRLLTLVSLISALVVAPLLPSAHALAPGGLNGIISYPLYPMVSASITPYQIIGVQLQMEMPTHPDAVTWYTAGYANGAVQALVQVYLPGTPIVTGGLYGTNLSTPVTRANLSTYTQAESIQSMYQGLFPGVLSFDYTAGFYQSVIDTISAGP